MMVEMVVQLILFLISAIWDGIDGGGFLGHQELLPKCIVLQINTYICTDNSSLFGLANSSNTFAS